MIKSLLLLGLLAICSCAGPFKVAEVQTMESNRQVASMPHKHFTSSDNQGLSAMVDERLQALHSYYLIGHKNLFIFDEEIKNSSLKNLYSSSAYMNLLAVQTQTEEIEEELRLFAKDPKQAKILQERIEKFVTNSELKALSVEKLPGAPALSSPKISLNDFKNEWETQERSKEFVIYERNIEHLSHMLDVPKKNTTSKFSASLEEAGNVTGGEFPAKVWSISFNNAVNESLLQQLAEQNLQANFFLLGSDMQDKQSYFKVLQSQGHSIGASSWSKKELTKVGRLTLEKEINATLETLSKNRTEVKFFRLPYGAGVSASHIRSKLVEHNLIHASWSVDAIDWMPQPASQIVKRTLALMAKDKKDSGLIMFHAVHPRISDATAQIMSYLKKDGRRVCTLDEIVSQMNEGVETVCPLN